MNLDDIEEVKRKPKKNILLSVRTTEEIVEFMKEHNTTISLVFHKAMEELMNERTR